MSITQRLAFLSLLALSFVLFPGFASAQEAPEDAPVASEIETPTTPGVPAEAAPEPVPSDSEAENPSGDVVAPDLDAIDPQFLFSVAGLATFGVIFTSFARRLIPDVPILGGIPVVLWPTIGAGVGMGIGLALGVFDGDIQTVATQIIVAGLLAVGGHASIKNLPKTPANTN